MERDVIQERKQQTIKIPSLCKFDLIISERNANDVLEVADYASKNSGMEVQMVGMAKSISDALKINIDKAKSIRKRWFQKVLDTKNILDKLTPNQMLELLNVINELEGNITSKKAEGKELEDTLQNGSLEAPSPQSESMEPNNFQSEATEQQ